LRDNADKIKQVPGVMIQIEGHCDERGTQEYNLALGEKRALAVRDHLIQLGISPSRLVTISYGEESPEVEGHDESAWKFNRRCEFNKATM
jgi:peptidoglycan-associated lipoprotein